MVPCEVCSKKKECDYIDYTFLGFRMPFLVCKDCALLVRINALSALKKEVRWCADQLKGTKYENPTDGGSGPDGDGDGSSESEEASSG